jgi:hypothetical protein
VNRPALAPTKDRMVPSGSEARDIMEPKYDEPTLSMRLAYGVAVKRSEVMAVEDMMPIEENVWRSGEGTRAGKDQ